METPRRRLTRSSKLSKMSPRASSTPLSTPTSGRTLGSVNGRKFHRKSPRFSADDDIMPCTQAMANSDTGVFWNYEASPSAKAKLNRLLSADSDDEDRLPSPKPVTPAVKLRMRAKARASPIKFDQEALDMLESMRDIYAKIQAHAKPEVPPEPLVKESPKKGESFADDSADNSFLIACTQAAEEEAFKKPPKTSKRPEVNNKKQVPIKPSNLPQKKLNKSTAFDDDDEFDMMLSQMEVPKAKTPVAKMKKQQKPDLSSWRRINSSPEATTTSGSLLPNHPVKQRHQTVSGAKCSKADIEKKRQEALKRRQNSQKKRK